MRSMDCDRGRERARSTFPAPVSLGRDVWSRSARLDLPTDRVAIVTFVSVQDAASRQMLQEQRARRAVGDLPAGQQERHWAAELVGDGVDLGGAPTARAADGLALVPPFAAGRGVPSRPSCPSGASHSEMKAVLNRGVVGSRLRRLGTLQALGSGPRY